MQAAPGCTRPAPLLQLTLLWPPANSPTRSISTAAITVAMTQPRTVRNLVHSARRIRPNPSRSCGRRPGRGRAMVAVIAPPPGRARDRPG